MQNKLDSPLKGTPVLVTGGGGFIGSHLTRKLVSLGADVNVILKEDKDDWRIRDLSGIIRTFACDVRNVDKLRGIVSKVKPNKAFHLAAILNVSNTFEALDEVIDINIRGTLNVAKALSETGCSFLALAGSCDEYGGNTYPFREDMRPEPRSYYSCSKVSSSMFCNVLASMTGMEIVTLRFFTVYGPRQEEKMFIPQLIISALRGKDIDMTGGEQTRDFIFVDDVVEAYVKASVATGLSGQYINIGAGKEYKIKDVASKILGLMGWPIKLNIGALPYRKNEMWHAYADCTKAKALLCWEAKADIYAGLKLTIDWYKENNRRYL